MGHGPARPARAARPRLHHRPPEEQAGREEAGVLDRVPAGTAQRELVERRAGASSQVAATSAHQHDDRMRERAPPRGAARARRGTARARPSRGAPAARAAAGSPARRAGAAAARPSSAAGAAPCVPGAAGRRRRRAATRRRRRGSRARRGSSRAATTGKRSGICRRSDAPAAHVDQREQQQDGGESRSERPRREDRVRHGAHRADVRAALTERRSCDASRAGTCSGGCMVRRKATIAVTSAGLRFLPYAGMLPPPCRTWRIELVAREPRRDVVERGPAQAALAAERVAVAALLALHQERALQLERRAAAHVLDRRRRAAPRVHVRRPRRGESEPGERRRAIRKTSTMPRTDTGRRSQLFSPVPEMNGSARSSDDAERPAR